MMDYENTIYLLFCPLFLQLICLTAAVMLDSTLIRKRRKSMLIIAALVFVQAAADYLNHYFSFAEKNRMLRILVDAAGYSVRPAILVLFCRIVKPDQDNRAAWIVTGVNAAVHLTAFFSGICFTIGEDLHFRRGPLGYTCHVVSALLMIYLFNLTIRTYGRGRKREIVIPVLNMLLIAGAVCLDGTGYFSSFPISVLTYAVMSCSVFYYIWLHLQFMKEQTREEQSRQRIRIMLTQIKPHFLYNSLSAIEELCDSDPKMAKEATGKFAKYLRGNMNSLSQEGTIRFEEELAHTKLYLELEQLRFGEDLQVSYEIDCTDFSLPTLTLEPLVENAVRHGIRGSEEGTGTVTVSSREYPDRYEVCVEDDGCGFDPESIPDDAQSHIGLENVRNRLKIVCGGSLVIHSGIGKGTSAIIILPKDEV